jgi:hypothetical protein
MMASPVLPETSPTGRPVRLGSHGVGSLASYGLESVVKALNSTSLHAPYGITHPVNTDRPHFFIVTHGPAKSFQPHRTCKYTTKCRPEGQRTCQFSILH